LQLNPVASIISHRARDALFATTQGALQAMQPRYWRFGLLALVLAAGGTLLYLWLTLLSPFGYEYPEHMAPETTDTGYHKVFVYGTLRFAPVRWIVKGRAGDPPPHTLEGYRKTGLDIRPDPDSEVEGLLLQVSNDELRRLDRYERLGVQYRREAIELDDGRQAWIYQLKD